MTDRKGEKNPKIQKKVEKNRREKREGYNKEKKK